MRYKLAQRGMEWNKAHIFDKKDCGRESSQIRRNALLLTSVNAPPQRLMEIARTHWEIENMHWMLDVVFSEDKCSLQTKEAQLTMNIFRKFGLASHKNYVKQKGKKDLSQAICYDA